jgi:hypothetical protein
LVAAEIDILDPKSRALEQPETRAIQEKGHQAGHSTEFLQDGTDLFATQHGWEPPRPLRPHERFELREIGREHRPIEEDERVQRLILCGRAHLPVHRKPGQEPLDLQGAHLGRMTLPVEEDEPPDPADVGLFRPAAVVTDPERRAHAIEKSWTTGEPRWGFADLKDGDASEAGGIAMQACQVGEQSRCS